MSSELRNIRHGALSAGATFFAASQVGISPDSDEQAFGASGALGVIPTVVDMYSGKRLDLSAALMQMIGGHLTAFTSVMLRNMFDLTEDRANVTAALGIAALTTAAEKVIGALCPQQPPQAPQPAGPGG